MAEALLGCKNLIIGEERFTQWSQGRVNLALSLHRPPCDSPIVAPWFLQHVLPKGFQKVRHYGFMHARSKVTLAWLKMLVTLTLNLVYVIEVGLDRSEPRLKQNPKCTECGGELLFIGFEVAKPQVSGMFDSS
jgi:hypothetical protein